MLPKESHIAKLRDFKTYEYEIANFFRPMLFEQINLFWVLPNTTYNFNKKLHP